MTLWRAAAWGPSPPRARTAVYMIMSTSFFLLSCEDGVRVVTGLAVCMCILLVSVLYVGAVGEAKLRQRVFAGLGRTFNSAIEERQT